MAPPPPPPDYDAVIIGGGPAGATAALCLAAPAAGRSYWSGPRFPASTWANRSCRTTSA